MEIIVILHSFKWINIYKIVLERDLFFHNNLKLNVCILFRQMHLKFNGIYIKMLQNDNHSLKCLVK